VENQRIRKKNPNGGERKKATKRGVSNKWQLNSITLVEFVRPHQMVIEMDLAATKFYHHHSMANKMHLVTPIKW
jgi:hypothetical protein